MFLLLSMPFCQLQSSQQALPYLRYLHARSNLCPLREELEALGDFLQEQRLPEAAQAYAGLQRWTDPNRGSGRVAGGFGPK